MNKTTAVILFIIELIILGYLFSRIWIMIGNYHKKVRKTHKEGRK